jgi:integrase
MKRRKIRVRKYRDINRPHLKFVVNYREAGKRKRSFFETKEAATTFANEQNIKLVNEGRSGAEFPTALRVTAQECHEALSAYGKTLRDATDFLIAHLKASEKSCTASALVDELVAAKKRDGASQRHVQDLRSRLDIFAEKFDGRLVATTTSAEIDDWLRFLSVSPVTRNHYRRLIVLAFNFAVQRGYATSNPAERTAKAKEIPGDIGILTITQSGALLVNATREILPYIAIGLFAGLRRAEIERLNWSEIDFESNLIEVKAKHAKRGGRRLVTMLPNLREWLLPFRKLKSNVTPHENFRELFDQAREGAGIGEWPDNALRHSYASYHLAHFKNENALAVEMGSSSQMIRKHYRELVKPKEAERYWNIRPAVKEKIVPMVAGA